MRMYDQSLLPLRSLWGIQWYPEGQLFVVDLVVMNETCAVSCLDVKVFLQMTEGPLAGW